MFLRVLVRDDRRTGRMHPFIAVRVIEMPMRVHKMFNRVATDAIQRLGNFFARAEVTRINDQLAIVSWKDGNVSTRAEQDTDVITQRLKRNLCCLATFARSDHQTLLVTGKAIRDKADSGCRKTSVRNKASPRNVERSFAHDLTFEEPVTEHNRLPAAPVFIIDVDVRSVFFSD